MVRSLEKKEDTGRPHNFQSFVCLFVCVDIGRRRARTHTHTTVASFQGCFFLFLFSIKVTVLQSLNFPFKLCCCKKEKLEAYKTEATNLWLLFRG